MKHIAGSSSIALFVILAVAAVGCTREAAIADSKIADAKAPATRDDPSPAPRYEALVVPAGTNLVAVLQTLLSTDANSTGDAFAATTVDPVIVDGRIVVPAGSRIDGMLHDVQASGRIKDRARMTLVFYELSDPAGETHAISAVPLKVQAASETRDDVLKIVAGAAAGAAIGAITGEKNGVVIGAAAGAGAGTILVLATKGADVELEIGQRLSVELTGPTTFMVVAR